MQLRSEIQIASMIKAMKDVVIPALDSSNRLAIEQSQLIVGMLDLLASQLPIQFRFDRDELGRLLLGLESLAAICAEAPSLQATATQLREQQAAAAELHARCSVDPGELTAAVRALRVAVSAVVVEAGQQAPAATAERIERVVLALSREQLLRDRAMVAPQGWEADPAALPSIRALLPAPSA